MKNTNRTLIGITLGVVCIGLVVYFFNPRSKDPDLKLTTSLEQFIWSEMVNDNHTLKTTFQATSPAYSLSESLGLAMEYAVLSNNQALFDHSYAQLEDYFLTNDNNVHWRVLANGKATEHVNAFLDDIRIVGALLDAGELWDSKKYLVTAEKITNTLTEQGTYEATFVDFYDWHHNEKSHDFSITYLDLETIRRVEELGWVSEQIRDNMEQIAVKAAGEPGPLFPKNYNIENEKFLYGDTVNMVEQVYAAYHLTRAGIATENFHTFLKDVFIAENKLFGQYETATVTPAVTYESPALYGIAILYTLELDDEAFALDLYDRLKVFQRTEGPYQGAYFDESSQDTHVFDNLFPLLAERSLQNSEIIQPE
ncbi:glycosyl hydrolase family 8 [Radiobacillus sp. PE A8.2]|uniref:glycosyl hydrolase family 8 n=1 Tax=Radiobacillus sp. PE A8.2 TaxID=3380349 RepID=UPI00388E3AC2